MELAPVSNTESDYRQARARSFINPFDARRSLLNPIQPSHQTHPTQTRNHLQIIKHYALPAGQPGHHCHLPRSLFLTSLGPLIERSGRRFDEFYRQPPKNPHPNLLGYEAMGDMLAYHIKV